MSIGFLRRHQKRVFWPLAIIIIVTFVFWGAGSALFGRRSRETYAEIDGQALTYGELKRTAYIMLQLSGRPVSPDDVVRRMILNKAINNADVQVSLSEVRRYLQQRMKAPLGEDFTEADYQRYLMNRQISAARFQRLAEEELLRSRMERLLVESAIISGEEEYLNYCWAKDKLTIRYVDFGAEDYRKKVDPPAEEDILEYYTRGTEAGYSAARELFDPPSAQIRYLLANFEDFESKVDVTEEKLKTQYERTKHRYHVDEPEAEEHEEAGEHPKHKSFEEVRDEVEKDFRKDKSRPEADGALKALLSKIRAGEEDLENAAKDAGIVLGKTESVTSKDLQDMEPFGVAGRLAAAIFDSEKRPSPEEWSRVTSAEKGVVSFQLVDFSEARKLDLTDCRAAIIEELTQRSSAKAALAAAEQARKDLLAERFDRSEMAEAGPLVATDPEVQAFQDKAVGDVAEVYDIPSDEDKVVFRVGILTDRLSPSREAFAGDKRWRPWYGPRYTRSMFFYTGWYLSAIRSSRAVIHRDQGE